jgi:hypothetical protein
MAAAPLRVGLAGLGSARLLGEAITELENPCLHGPARQVAPWTGEPGTAGTAAVVGAGKMGLPLAAAR